MKKIFIYIAIALMAALTACNHQGETHEHHHEGQTVTVYSHHYELYGEVQPLIVGQPGKITAHLTKLADFKPLDSTKVTFTLQLGEKGLTQSRMRPATPGIYTFEVTPKEAGCAKLVFEVEREDGVETIVYNHIHIYASEEEYHHSGEGHSHNHEGCSHEGEEHEHEHAHNHEGHQSHSHEHEHSHAEGNSNAITFTKEQSWKVDFATELVKSVNFGQVIKTTAQVLPTQGDERIVTAKTSGIIIFANANMAEGTSVAAGSRMFSIESSGMADNNMSVKFQEAVSNYNTAKANYERKQTLAQDKIVSQSELEQAKAAYDNATAAYNSLKGNFSAKGQVVVAPIGGFVKQIHVQNGGYVEAGQPIATISQNRDLFVRAELQPRYYDALKNISSANFQPLNSKEVYTLESLSGSLVSYGKSTDANNPLIPVTFRIRNTVNLLSGSFLNIYIKTTSDSPVVTVPNSGIVEEMGAYFIFVQIDPEHFEKREATLGATDGVRTVILSGLRAGERVVSKGAIMVKLAQGSGALDPHAGHVH